MSKQRNISAPKIGMNRATSPHLLSDNEFLFQLNGASYDEGGEKFNLTDEHSNILASKFKDGFKFIGGKNHVVRDKTYIFLTNPTTRVSEIGCIQNITDFTIDENTVLEDQTQTEHQVYETLLEDSCNLCLGFDINNPIFDIIIKEENIGTKLFWTSTPGNKEFRYIELDNLDQYKVTGSDNCGDVPTATCLDCDKLRVFPLYTQLKAKSYERALGGNLRKGSYEILGAYSDILGNEFTSYTSLTPIIPIFDEANIIHEQEDNNAETNFSIKLELDSVDENFDHYKIAVRYYTSKGVFVSFVEGIHNTSDKLIILSNNDGQSINNTTLSVVKPFVETVDGATASNNILFLNGVREREPINLQPVMSLAGLGVQWMSFRAKEDLYANADSYKFTGYNRDENTALAIDFGLKDGYRTNPYIFIPRRPTVTELQDFDINSDDYKSITDVVGECDGNIRTKNWQFYNYATEIGVCPLNENIATTTQTEDVTTFTTIEEVSITSGQLVVGKVYRIDTLNAGDDFSNVGFATVQTDFTATATTPTTWTNNTTVFNITDGVPPVPPGSITDVDVDPADAEDLDLRTYIEDNIDDAALLQGVAPYVDLANLTTYNNVPNEIVAECTGFTLENETINIPNIVNEKIVFTYPPDSSDYASIVTNDRNIYERGTEVSLTDIDFSISYHMQWFSTGNQIRQRARQRSVSAYNTKCRQSADLQRIENGDISSIFQSYYHDNMGALTLADMQNANIDMPANANDNIGTGINDDLGGTFTNKMHQNALWFKTNSFDREKFYINLSKRTRCNIEAFEMNGTAYTFGRNEVPYVRISFFNSCGANSPIEISTGVFASDIYDLRSSTFIEVTSDIISQLNNSGDLYISVESAIRTSQGIGPNWEELGIVEFNNPNSQSYRDATTTVAPTLFTTYISALPCGSWGIVDRDEEPETVSFSWDKIEVQKLQKYTTTCDFEIPVLQDCEPVPFKYGELGYFESTDAYPDNEELFNSSNLVINKSTITNADLLSKIILNYGQSETATQVNLSSEADFRCKNIRHYKLPDNKVSPFISTDTSASNSDTIISPLGFTIDGEVINNLLDVAVENNLITQDQRDSIVDYKIYRADSTLDRSVVGSGIAFNTKKYTVEGEDIHYFNYPFNSLGKDKYFPENTDTEFDKMQVISPEFDYFKPSLPSEMSMQGFVFGKSNSRVLPVEDHSKMVILGRKARDLANDLAVLEVVTEILIQTSQVAANAQVWFIGGLANGGSFGIPAFTAAAVVAAIGAVEGLVSRVGRYRLEWERSFENLGTPYNFGYYTASGSNYNYLKTLQIDGDRLRGLSTKKYLKSGMLNVSDTVAGAVTKINNIDREEAPFFSLGNYPINNLDAEYTSFDNADTAPNFSSQLLSSEIGCNRGKSPEQLRNVASPYIAFKNYIPNQYGTVGSIKWIDTTYCVPIEEVGVCNGILGGDTFISRHSKKRQARMFEADLLNQADLTPFPYRFNSNYGDPKYYIDYKVNSEVQTGSKLFPSIFYDVAFDCYDNRNVFYVEPPSKFYLYNIAFANFLCETRINTNFRNARKEPWNQFYPQNTDYEAITQPTTVGLTRVENFFYNKAYLQTDVLTSVFTLPDYYSSEDEARRAYNKNSIIYSLPDVNEDSITEPWLLYRPNDRATLDSSYGDLVNVKGIESDQILLYFEDAMQLQNAINPFTDGSTEYNKDLGNGGIFAKRAQTLRSTDIGYGGAQSKNTLSCEFGHFHADLKRGQVFNYLGGNNLQEISRYSNGKPNGMDVWFKEHLPLKFIKQFPTYEGVLDNPYNGIGIHWGYDSKYRRVILTKKDYVLADGITLTYDPVTNTFDGGTSLQDQIKNGNLKDVSWTITYKPETGSWESYMSYTPNYYINHTDYFQSGVNSDDDTFGLWSHLLTNKSYRVFYGQKFPYIIEYPVTNKYFSKRLESLSWNAQLRRHHNQYDYAVLEENPFTIVTIYNNYENSGNLIPVKNTGALSQLSRYPITNSDNTQDVLISYDNYRYNLNYFYNRVISNTNNQPTWLWDENQIGKTINPAAVSFTGKKKLERLKGNFFTVRLERDGNTNYDLDFRWSEQTLNPIST